MKALNRMPKTDGINKINPIATAGPLIRKRFLRTSTPRSHTLQLIPGTAGDAEILIELLASEGNDYI
jgi:hypothetical protein